MDEGRQRLLEIDERMRWRWNEKIGRIRRRRRKKWRQTMKKMKKLFRLWNGMDERKR